MKSIPTFFIFMCAGLYLHAQACINFTYDAAGMRVSRYSCASRPTAASDRESTAIADTLRAADATSVSMRILPNPTQSLFWVNADGCPPETEVRVWNETGQFLLSRPLGDGLIDLSSYPPGHYFVRLNHANSRKSSIVLKTNN